jgi:Kazal-type serine protease inhibitor domain
MELPMRFHPGFVLSLLTVAGACTTDDSATGVNDLKVDTSEPASAAADGGGTTGRADARANKPAADSAAGHSGDDRGPTSVDGGVLEDSSVSASADASTPGVDASAPVRDAGEPLRDASAPKDASAPGTDAGSGRCGTRGGVQCKAGEFCDFGGDPACGATDKGGVCRTVTRTCVQIYAPVCGCDGRSYGSQCDAHGAGVSVMHDQLCTPQECEALGGKVKYSTGADMPKCGAGQESWNLSGGIEPVVCCLGKGATPNPTDPPVPVDPGFCGGFAGFPCGVGEFCNYEAPKGQGCDMIADGTGVCEAIPQVCTAIYDPVCACNGQTFPSACSAHAAGASVKSRGACP